MNYDVIIVGAGAGGGVAAGVLAEAGKRVLLLERGRNLSFDDIPRDHLRHQRLSQYGHNAGPDINGNPRTLADGRVVRPHEGGYQNNAAIVGSGTVVYGAQAWRFMPQDFQMASIYGVPEGSSLADWPITYDDIAPFYEKVEWEMGVAGDHNAMTQLPPFNQPYPMSNMELSLQGQAHKRGLKRLGWHATPVPLLINTQEHNGRPACTRCQHCVGFACPVDAKNGTQNTLIQRAIESDKCELVSEAMAERILTDANGHVTGIAYIDRDGQRVEATAEVVVLSAGAVETARLMLNSANEREPNGIGNDSDIVGRNLQGHFYPSISGLFEEPVRDNLGPGASIATCQFNHGNVDVIGGGMLADEFLVLPIIFWKRFLPPEIPRWGAANKTFMREKFRYVSDVKGPVHEIPSPDARVSIDPKVKDRYGIPVAHLSGTTHPETVRTAKFMFDRAKEWIEASGAVKTWGKPPGLRLTGGQHQAGTCRMGHDPQSSVVDANCRVHGHDNLYIADGSVHVTNGGFNPVLTIMALAWRTAEHIAEVW